MPYLKTKVKPSIWLTTICIALYASILLFSGQIEKLKAITNPSTMPDFFIEDLRLDTPNPTVGQQILFSAKLKNIGDATIEEWSVQHENNANPGTSIGTYFTDIGPGEYAQYPETSTNSEWLSQGGFVVYEDLGPGEYTFKVTLDPYNELDELNENNNYKEITITVGLESETSGECTANATRCIYYDEEHGGPSDWVQYCNPTNLAWTNLNECPNGCSAGACTNTTPNLPDLLVTSIKTTTAPTYSDTITINSTIKNDNGGFPASNAAVYLNDVLLLNSIIPSSANNEINFSVAFPVEQLQNGDNLIKVITDSDNVIVEANEINNTKIFTLKYNDTAKDKISYWWGKVNQHTADNAWLTDPNGTSGANLDKYQYCKKWYPETNYAVYDNREYIDGFQNAGNVNSYSETPPTYECTTDDVITEYQIQKKLFKNNEELEVELPSGTAKIKIVASTAYNAYTTCGDTMVQFYVNGNYASRYFCAEDSNIVNNVKVTLNKIIHGNNQIYLVADVEQVEGLVTPFIYHKKTTPLAQELIDKIKGKILLRVENKGETFYVPPQADTIYYFNDEDTTNDLISQQGIGITNENLSKIPIGLDDINYGDDSDADGLADVFEEAIGTDKNDSDTDNDSYLDGEEITHGYTPKGTGKQLADTNFANSLKGKILLQIQSRGEAWYISPADGKRYYLKKGETAYEVLSKKNQGISDNDLSKIIALDN